MQIEIVTITPWLCLKANTSTNCNTCFMFAFWGSMWVWVALPAYNGFLAPDDVRQRVVLNRWVV